MLSSFKKHFQLIVFRKLLEWKLEKSYTKKYTCHLDLRQRSHWNTNGRDSFCEEPSSSERTERLLTGPIPGKPDHETSVIQTRSSEDRKDFNVEQAHERTVRLVITHEVINVSDSSQTRSAHESETFNVGDEILRKRTERSVADHDVSHAWVNDGERGGHGLPNFRTTTFHCEARAEYQRSRIDSENWEPSRSTCSSTRSTTKSIIESFQSRIKTHDSGCA